MVNFQTECTFAVNISHVQKVHLNDIISEEAIQLILYSCTLDRDHCLDKNGVSCKGCLSPKKVCDTKIEKNTDENYFTCAKRFHRGHRWCQRMLKH